MTEDTLSSIIGEQLKLQQETYGIDPLVLEGQERIDFIMWNVYALEDELHELTGEIGWKPWATSEHVNESPAFGEWIDALHFFVNILLAISPRPGTDVLDETVVDALTVAVLERYQAKRAVNAQRQVDGYDGVSSKCRSCKRDLDEVGTTFVGSQGGSTGRYCNGCGAKVIDAAASAGQA